MFLFRTSFCSHHFFWHVKHEVNNKSFGVSIHSDSAIYRQCSKGKKMQISSFVVAIFFTFKLKYQSFYTMEMCSKVLLRINVNRISTVSPMWWITFFLFSFLVESWHEQFDMSIDWLLLYVADCWTQIYFVRAIVIHIYLNE